VAEAIIKNFKSPDLSGHAGPYYYLAEMAVRWCIAHPAPLPHKADPSLHI
jgi:hypothetical protein